MGRKKFSSPNRSEILSTGSTLWNNPWLAGLLLVVMTFIAYQQTSHLGYIWDDDYYVTHNSTLRDLHGLWRIWFELTATPQYYPLVHSSYWLEYHLWGLNPAGYHLVNVALHAVAVLLLWRVLLQLRAPGAWLAAAIFALHPVEVESVAWITERKNVLSAVFYFAAALAYLRFVAVRDGGESSGRRWFFYFGSLVLFAFALFSKTVACSLPVALLLAFWWKNGRLEWRRDILPLAPFLLLGLVLGLCTAWLEKHYVGATGMAWSLTFCQRFLIAGRALWFYAGKLFWPAKLTFIYPRWEIDASSAAQWLFPLAAGGLLLGLWLMRRRLGRGPFAAVLFFAATLGPALGFIDVFPFRYSFVADHFQYLASVGLIVLAAAALQRLPRVMPGILLAVLAALTWKQTAIYRNLTVLWQDTVDKNPTSWMAQNSLGMALLSAGKRDEAIAHLQQALTLDSNNVESQNNFGFALLRMGRARESLPYLHKARELEPNRAAVHCNLGDALLQVGLPEQAAVELQQALNIDPTMVAAYSNLGYALLQLGRAEESLAPLQKALALEPNDSATHFNLANSLLHLGHTGEALDHLKRVLAADPNDAEAQKNMAWILATSPDPHARDGAKAVQLAESANRLTDGRNPIMNVTLAAAYAEAGRFPEAIKTAEVALHIANDSGSVALTQFIREQIALYRSGQPFRDIRPAAKENRGQ